MAAAAGGSGANKAIRVSPHAKNSDPKRYAGLGKQKGTPSPSRSAQVTAPIQLNLSKVNPAMRRHRAVEDEEEGGEEEEEEEEEEEKEKEEAVGTDDDGSNLSGLDGGRVGEADSATDSAEEERNPRPDNKKKRSRVEVREKEGGEGKKRRGKGDEEEEKALKSLSAREQKRVLMTNRRLKIRCRQVVDDLLAEGLLDPAKKWHFQDAKKMRRVDKILNSNAALLNVDYLLFEAQVERSFTNK